MMKQILKLVILLLLFVPLQKAVGQGSIVMGSAGSYMFFGSIDDQPIYFYDPGGPIGYFGQGCSDTVTLRTSIGGTQLYVLFEDFVMDAGDTLWIFDGDTSHCDDAHLLGIHNLVNSPGELYASGREMTFVFHSDSMEIPGLKDGWKAQVYAYDPVSQDINYGEYTTVLTCNAYFYDAGGTGNINANGAPANNFTEFTSPLGTHIKCVFESFSVGGVLKIYDGQFNDLANRRLIGQFCASTLDVSTNNMPPVLFSSTNTLAFEYVGGTGDANKSGWKARITCEKKLFNDIQKENALNSSDPCQYQEEQCPRVVNHLGGLYQHLDSDERLKVVEFNCSTPVVVLEAGVVATGQYTNDYTVEQLPYCPPVFNYTEGADLNFSSDDSWPTAVNLGFKFKFFGQEYQTVYPGTNGLISMSPQSGFCEYSYNAPPASPPYSSIPYKYKNCIYGVYEDIDPRYYNSYMFNTPGAIRASVLGEYPCRAFVFNYLNVGLFGHHSAPSNYNTYQMALYEGSNIIDVYVKHRDCCASTNGSGEGIIGLQNKTSSQILIAPGRGMSSWTADDEVWRFTPITPLDEYGELSWYEDTVDLDHRFSYDPTAKSNRIITVSPSDTTVYISEYKYINAVGDLIVRYDTTTINVNIPRIRPVSSNGETPVCPGDSVFLTVEIDTTLQINPALYGGYTWSTSKADTFAIDTVLAPVGIDTATYYVTLMFENGCVRSDSVKVAITELVMPTITGMNSVVDTDSICIGDSYILTATHPDINVFKWSTNQTTPSITVKPQITTDYVVSATLEGGCEVTDTFTVVVMPLPNPSFIPNPTEIFVDNGVGTVQCTNTSNEDYAHLVWNFGDAHSNVNIVQNIDDPTHDYTRSGHYTITLTATDMFGCVDSVKARVSVSVPYFFYIPSAFTPDGDGLNETFAPKGEGVDPDHYSMQIFDRSGVLIFSTRNPYDYWDGRSKNGQMCSEGVYVYKINLFNLNEEDKEYIGTVTLVR